jgi:hypothetical protein
MIFRSASILKELSAAVIKVVLAYTVLKIWKQLNRMNSELLQKFFETIKSDPRISPVHISLYAVLYLKWSANKYENPIYIFSDELKPFCKISGPATYHRSIRQLHEYGYIRYVPSFNHCLGSLVYFLEMHKNYSQIKF